MQSLLFSKHIIFCNLIAEKHKNMHDFVKIMQACQKTVRRKPKPTPYLFQ